MPGLGMFPHTITLYSLDIEPSEDFNDRKIYNATVLKGVLFDATKAANVNKSGLVNADSVMVYIPFAVDTGVKTYLPPVAYGESAEKVKHWTLRTGAGDFFVKGEIIDPGESRDGTPHDYEYMRTYYDDVYLVSTVDRKDFGSPDMRLWEVGGR